MFYYLEGTVAHTEPYLAVIDCGGVGYLCHVTAMTQARIKQGQKARLFTHLNVREDAMELYGFADIEERNCFLLLVGISGVGMKVGLSILSSLTPERFAMAVLGDDERARTAVPGVGKKLAQRIILELKDKLKGKLKDRESAETFLPDTALPGGNALDEARMALQVLGYSPSEASAALRGCDPAVMNVEEMIRAALKQLAR